MMHETHLVTEQTSAFLAANFRNTELGLIRIARNLGLGDFDDVKLVEHLRRVILSTPSTDIKIQGKNFYLTSAKYRAVLTINRSSLGIITAKPLGKVL